MFKIHAPSAHHLHLAIFNTSGKAEFHEMQPARGGDYYVSVEGVKAGTIYSYCLKGKNGRQWLVDPYAKALATHPEGTRLPAAVVTDDNFDWQGVKRPELSRSETILFETHVKGFSKLHPDVPASLQGTYLGLCHPAMIAHFKKLGINTLQLMPVTSSVDEPHLHDKQLTNYWGYNPLCWFAPDDRFAIKDPVLELKTLVRELHRNGIEVILDVVYNHTAEGGEGGPTFHFKALDPKFYLHSNKGKFENFTGCGNTVDLTHPPALMTVMDSLRYWVEEFHIDGFRFDLAATLGRRGKYFDPKSGFFQAIFQDPVLRNVKLIAEPWDIGPDGYQVGHFPEGWMECNDKYRDTIRSFWHGAPHLMGEVATRVMGSRDILSAANWPEKMSVNYISYHDGFTLQDLVSYRKKHNNANGEHNHDGHGDNRSNNHGTEGPTDDPAITALREKEKRNFMATLLFSFGVPHILATDSRSHTQQGNNNAYCQDNEISWTNWEQTPVNQAFEDWLCYVVSQRQKWMLPMIDAFSGLARNENRVAWHLPDGAIMTWQDWETLDHVALHLGIEDDGDELMMLINSGDNDIEFILPGEKPWICIVDTETGITAEVQPSDMRYDVKKHSLVILRR
ncbi:glycogen debranching protein GlgX [Parasalinivibrio latis]